MSAVLSVSEQSILADTGLDVSGRPYEVALHKGISVEARISRPARQKIGTERFLKVVRRLRGILLEMSGEKWRVAFIEKNERILYDLPVPPLKRAGITRELQPFEMDELVPIDPELSGKLYRFRPLSKANDTSKEILQLDPARTKKVGLILARLKKTQD